MIEPISPARFPCEEIPRYRKKAAKKTPKKANHKHEYEPVILSYINDNAIFDTAQGFIAQRDYVAGSRCTVCGKLAYGFPTGPAVSVASIICFPWVNGTVKKHIVLLDEFKHLPIVNVNDIWRLKEETKNG